MLFIPTCIVVSFLIYLFHASQSSNQFHIRYAVDDANVLNANGSCYYNWMSLFSSRTSSPGLKAGKPIYGHPSHLNASPSAQLPQLPTLPWTVKSTSARSSASSFNELSALSAEERLAASSASSFSFMPQVQSL